MHEIDKATDIITREDRVIKRILFGVPLSDIYLNKTVEKYKGEPMREAKSLGFGNKK